MSVVHVAVPMLRGRRRFKIEKGRRWSVIEHLMLDAVAKQPSSAATLAKKSKLPRRIVVEAFIRLMRVGWVEITPGPDGPIFRTTASGIVQAESDEMLAPKTLYPRWFAFSVDRVAGSVFRGREMPVRPKNKITAPEGETVVYLEPTDRHSREDLALIFAALENEDEVILGTEAPPEPLFEGYSVIPVREGVIESLPNRANEELKKAILSAAASAGSLPTENLDALPAVPAKSIKSNRGEVEALFDHDDVVLDATDHRNLFDSMVGRARKTILIHSTFVSVDGWKTALPALLGAASRGVNVHIFWGQDDDNAGQSSSRKACDALRAAVVAKERSEDIVVHPFTTGSHAKLLVADDGKGCWSAVVGSCNWLSTEFDSFDASLRLRDPAIVGEIIGHMASLSVGSEGIWNSTAGDLTALGRMIGRSSRPAGRTTRMRILLAPDHADLVLEARDQAVKRMMVTSHRIGIAGKPMTIIPALSAAKEKGVAVNLYYGRRTGPLSGEGAATLGIEMRQEGVDIAPVYKPRLHAKVLAWDDDALAVTSLNWLSKDPSETTLRSEIGVFVHLNKIADTFIRRFEHAKVAF